MKRFLVTLKDTSIYEIEVESETEDQAIDNAWERLIEMSEEEKNTLFSDSDGDATAEEIQ